MAKIVNQPKGGPPVMRTDERMKMFLQSTEPPITDADKETLNLRSKLVKGGDPELQKEFGYLAKQKQLPFPEVADPNYKYDQAINRLITKRNNGTASAKELQVLNYHFKKQNEYQNKLLQKDASLPDVGTQLLNSWKKDFPTLEDYKKQSVEQSGFLPSDFIGDPEKAKELNEEITYKLQLIPQLYKENNYEAVKGIQRSISDLLAENSDIFPQFKTYNTLNLISQKADIIKARQSINNAAASRNRSLGNQLATKLGGLPTTQKAQELEGAFMGVSQLSNMQFSVQDYLAGKTGPMGAEDIINLVPIPNSKFNQLTQKYLGKDLATPKSIMADEKERGRVALSSGLEMLSERPGDFYSAEALPAFLQNKEGFLQTEKYQRAAIDAEETFKNATLADYYDQFLETRRERANLLIYKKDLIAQHNRANELAKQLGRPPLPMLETEDVDNQLEDLDFQLRDLEEEIENIKTYNPEERYKKEYPLAYAYKQQHDYESARFNTPASLGASIFDLLTPSFLQRPGKQVTVQEKLSMAIAQGSKQIYDRWQDLDLSGSITSALFKDSERDKAKRNLWLQTGKYNSEGYTIGIDEEGNPVKSGQFFWTDKQGKYHFNPYATVESGLPVAEQMLETILLAEIGGAAFGVGSKIAGGAIEATGISTLGKLAAGDIASALSLDAAQLAKLSNVANKGKVLLSPGVQQRLLTFGSVMATTYPSIYQEEYKNFKNPVDARDVALLRASIESISESVIPNVASLYTKGTGAFLGIGRSYRSLLRDAVEGTTQKMFPGATNKFVRKFADSRFGQAVGTAGRYIKEKGKDLFQEAVVEEEAALFGNYFVDKIAKQKDSSYVMQNELTASNILKTAIEATAGMLITAPFMGGGTTRARNYDIASARWQVANNPEVFKSLATADFEAGKLTKEEYVNKVANINMMAEELKNLPINIGSIRDLDTLLEDKDAQLEYYSNYLQKQALNKLEAENPELAAEYKAGTKDISGIFKETKVTEEQRKAYEESVKDIDKKLYKTEKLASIYDNLTYEQKEEIVAKNFQRKYEKLVSHEDLSPLQLAMVIAQHEKDLEDNPETYAVQNQAYIESLKNSLGIVRSNFMDFIRNNNDNLTFEQLDYKLNFLLQPNSVFLGENEYRLAAKDLSRRMALSVGPYEEIEDENEFIEVVARNFVTSKYSEIPLTSNGKPLLVKMMDNYVNEKLFDKFVEGLPKEERKAKQDELSEKFLKRVVELKQTLKEGQAFPEITSVLEAKKEEEAKKAKAPEPAAAPQVREKYRSIYESYKEAKEAYNTEDANIYESMAAAELLKEATVEELLAGLESVKPIFEDVNVAKVIEDIQNGNTASLESLLTKKGVTKKAIAEFKDKLFPEITVQLPEIVVEEETADGAPEVEGLVELSEEPTEADEENENRVKVTQEKTRQEYLEQDRPNQVYLGITDTGFDEDRREDPNTDLIYSLVDRIQNSLAETNLRALGYHLLMKSDKDILALVGITPEYKEDYASFRAQFIINGIPVRSEATIAYYHKNFDLFGTYKVGIITDSNQSPLYFDKSGQKVKTGTPIIVNIGQPGEGPGKESDKKFKEAIPPQGQFVALSSFINGANVGREKIKSSVVGQLRLIVGQNETVTAESGKSYTLYKGVAYLPTGDVNFPYVSTYTPSVTRNTAVEVLALVKAFNEMTKNPEASTLPEYFKSMTLQEFHNYLNAYVYIPDNSKENSWGLVQTKRKGETERSHVKFFVRLENNKATVSLSEEDILNLLSGSKTEKGTIYAGIPKDFFNEGRTFRPFTVEDGKIKVGKITPFRNWFAQRSTIDKYSKTRPNRNLAFQKEDVVTLQAPTVTKEAPVSDIITDDVYNIFIDKNIVPDNILNSIADKIIARASLSQRETAIFSGKTSEINEIIRKKAPTAAPVSDKKADIERRRDTVLAKITRISGHGTKGIRWVSYEYTEEGKYKKGYSFSSDSKEETIKLINDKYNEELAALEAKPEAPKVETKVPTIEIGRYVQYSADKETYIITKLNANGTIQIYNPTKEGAAAKKSVSAKNLTPLEEIGKIVEYRDANYLVTPKNTIISLTTNKVMQWAEGDGNRKAILALANQAPQAPVITLVVEPENPAAETIEAALQSRIEEPTYVPEKNDEVSFTYYGKDYTGLFIRKTLDNNYVIQVPGEGQKEFIASAVSNITKVTEEPDLPTDFGPLERPKYLGNFISPVQNERARTWTNTIGKKIFGEDRLIFEQTLLHPSAYAVWSKAATRLFKDSNYADVYHEAWHEFTQMYFTAEERKTLYDRARKVYGDLTDIELEEKLAEDFRQFMLTGVMPESIQKSKEARNIFQKILDFLSNFFTNKKTIDRYFKNLAKGKVGRRVDFPQFKTLYSAKKLVLKENNKNVPLSFQETKGYLDLIDQLFLYVANEAGKQRGGTYVNILYNPKELNNVYNAVFNYIKKLRGEAKTTQDFVAYNELTRLIGPESTNFNRLKNLHFRYSPLFTTAIRLAAREAQEDEQGAQQGKDAFDQQEDGVFFSDKSITERSQEDYAEPLIINLIYALPLIENGEIVYNSLTGAPILGEFETNWNILKNTLQNSPSYDDMLDKIKTLAKDFSQFNSLLELLPAKGPIKRASDQQLRNQFYNVFSMGRTPGVFAKFGANGKFSVSNTSSLDTKGVKDIWLVNFNSTKDGLYKQLSAITGNYRLDAEALFEAYPEAPKTPEGMLSFLGAIGFNYAQKSQEDFIKNASKYETAVYYIYTKLKSYHYSTDEEIFDPFTVISTRHSYEEDGETKSYAGQGRYLNNLVQVEVDSNPAYANDMVIVADGTTQYMVNPPTYQTKIINALNDTRYEYFEDLFAPYPFLDPSRNWGLKGSADIDYLFDFNNPVKVGNEIKHPRKRTENIPNSLEVVNLQGTQSDISIMNKKTIDLSDAEKHLSDIRTLLSPYGRTEENNRIGEKATTRGKRITSDKYFLFNPNSFLRVDPQRGRLFSPKPEVWDIIFNYIKAEVEITNKNSTSTRFNKHKYTNGVPNLAFFSHILSDELRTKVYDSLTKNPVEDNQDFPYAKEVADEFLNWVKTLTKASRINVLSKLKESENKETDYYVEDFDLVRYHFISFIHRVEQFKLFNYHPYYYKNAADVAKRISGANATGNYPVVDKENVDFVNSSLKLNGFESFKKYAEHENITILPREGDNPTTEFTYIVFKDTPVDSKTAKENREDYGNNGQYYINEERESPADTQDAASILTLDTFKKFFSMEGKLDKSLSLEIQRQEKIWTNLIETKINPDNAEARQNLLDALNEGPYYIFSIKKLQYYGPGYKEVEIVPLFHKYSNKVLLPSEMVDNEELFNLAVKLYSSNADYGLFGSATKIAETISPVDFITEEGTIDITPTKAGVADLRFLKEQQEVEHKEDMLIIFATQFRKLLFRDMDTPKERELFATYKEQVEKLVDYDKGRFLKNIEDKELAVEFLINALSKKNVDAYTLDSIKYNEYTKDLQYSMDSILSRVVAESALMSETRKAIVRQKFYGSQFVQFPVSVIRPGKKLNFYRKKNGEILPAECIIAFSPKYYSLFSLPFDKNTTIGELDDKGKPVNVYEGLKRLNQKLAEDPSFREDNKEALRLAGVRIPVQGYNSMEYMEIVEFLPEESGDMILVPDELVVKSGGDFDIDKLFMYEPVLRDGKYLSEENRIDLSKELEKIEKIKAEKKDNQKTREELQEIADTFKTTVDKLKESLGYEEIEEVADESKNDPIETVKALSIAEERKLLQNQLLTTIKKRLSQPQIFEDLIEPNNVNNIKEGAKNAPDYLTSNFNKNTVANGREIWSNVVNPLYQLYVFQLASAKKMVGIAAKGGTFLTSAQEAKLNIIQFEATSQVYLDVHRNEKNEIELWRIKDVSGENKISQINSEAISGSVDILKNDDILRINFTPGTIPVVLYLNSMGARIKDVQKFIGEELIYRYDKGETFEDLLSEYPELLTKYGVFDQYGVFVEKATVTKISKAIKKNDFLTDETDEGKIKRLANFIVLKNQQSENITPLINTVDYDTANFQNFESIRRKINELDDLKKKRFFNADALEKIIKKSVVAPFEIQEDVLDKFAELFPISAERAFTNTIIRQYKAAKRLPKNKKLSYESFSRRYKNEFMTAVWQTISSEANDYIKYLEIGNEDNIVEKHRRLKVEAARLGINIPLLDTVMFTSATGSAYVAPGMRRSESNFDVDSWKENFNNNLEYTLPEDFVTEKNFLREDFEDDVREFFEILAYTGILTSRLSKTYSSYLTITPEQIYTPIVDKKLRTLGKAFKETFEKQKELNAKITKEIAEAEAKSPEGVITQAVTEEITDKYNKEFIQWVQSQPNFFEEAPTRAAISTAPITAEEIYTQLGNKTKSENVVIKPWGELKDATRPITPEGIVSTRIKTTDYNFGNIFSHQFSGNLIKTKTVKEAVERYINWVITGETGEYVFTGIQPEEIEEKRNWLLEQLKSGELKGKPILYYKELGEPSHATALDYLINKYDWSKPTTPTVSEGIEINSKQTGLGNDLTNVHYATNGKSKFDIRPSDASLTLTPEAKKTWGESVEAWYKSNNAKSKGIPEGTEGDAYDMKLMIGLITDKLKQYPDLVTQITERGGLAFLDKSTHTMGTGRWSSKNPKNMFMNALKQAYRNVSTTPTVITSTLTNVNFLERFRLRFINNNPDIFNTDFKLKPNPSLKYYKNYNLNESDASVLASYPPLVTTDKITYADEAASKAMLERAPFEEPEKLPAIELEVINKASKKSTYSIPSIAGEIIEKEGYKLDIPGYPNVSLYLTNQSLFTEEGKTRLVKQNGWMVDVASFGAMSPTVYKNLTEATEAIKDKVREVSQDPEKRKDLERIGFTEEGQVFPLVENPGTNLSTTTNPTAYDSDIVNEVNSKPTDESECNIS